MSQFWNERYQSPEYAYGETPNEFFKEQLDRLPPGAILMPADGEGRNGVYAAVKGWDVSAFDQSVEGQKKALQLAAKNGVSIHYLVNAFEDLPYQPQQFDCIGLIYAHFDADKKSAYHRALSNFLKPSGIVIFEAYSKKNLEFVARNPKVGGPKNVDMLFTTDEILADFPDFEVLYLAEEVIELVEGKFHEGEGCVVRFVGRNLPPFQTANYAPMP